MGSHRRNANSHRRTSMKSPSAQNDTLHLPGPLVNHCVARNRNAAPVRCKGWFAAAHPRCWQRETPRTSQPRAEAKCPNETGIHQDSQLGRGGATQHTRSNLADAGKKRAGRTQSTYPRLQDRPNSLRNPSVTLGVRSRRLAAPGTWPVASGPRDTASGEESIGAVPCCRSGESRYQRGEAIPYSTTTVPLSANVKCDFILRAPRARTQL